MNYTRRALFGALLGAAAAMQLARMKMPRPKVDRDVPKPEFYYVVSYTLHESASIGGTGEKKWEVDLQGPFDSNGDLLEGGPPGSWKYDAKTGVIHVDGFQPTAIRSIQEPA